MSEELLECVLELGDTAFEKAQTHKELSKKTGAYKETAYIDYVYYDAQVDAYREVIKLLEPKICPPSWFKGAEK